MSYSVNGQFLESITDESIYILSPLILKDTNSIESLVYGNEKGDIYQRDLPFLNIRRKIVISAGSPILSILLTKDRRFLIFGCGDGNISILTESVQSNKSSSIQPSQPFSVIKSSKPNSEQKSPEKQEKQEDDGKNESQPLIKVSSENEIKQKEN